MNVAVKGNDYSTRCVRYSQTSSTN